MNGAKLKTRFSCVLKTCCSINSRKWRETYSSNLRRALKLLTFDAMLRRVHAKYKWILQLSVLHVFNVIHCLAHEPGIILAVVSLSLNQVVSTNIPTTSLCLTLSRFKNPYNVLLLLHSPEPQFGEVWWILYPFLECWRVCCLRFSTVFSGRNGSMTLVLSRHQWYLIGVISMDKGILVDGQCEFLRRIATTNRF